VVLPLKKQRTICIGEVKSEYQFDAKNPDPFFHWRDVHWLTEGTPRDHFGQDLLHSFGAFMYLLEQLFAVYDKLSEEIRAELPLKRVWMVASREDG
jgi:predicted Mrr-cat superfamily restriction endonuclease